jgi:short-subunit dehydrogenase
MAYGTFAETPPEIFEAVIRTNLLGQVHGSRAALRYFVDQRAGVLINIGSTWGRVTSPLVIPYVVSKHAVRAFSESLRHELSDHEDIYVATIMPQAVDTPIFDHSANYTGKRLRPIPPILSPDYVAEGILACARSPKREVPYGRSGRSLDLVSTLLPALYRRTAPAMFMRGTFANDPVDPGDGNVLEPRGGARSGGWRASRRGDLTRALLAALAGLCLGLIGRSARARP